MAPTAPRIPWSLSPQLNDPFVHADASSIRSAYSMGSITDPLTLQGIALRALRQLVAMNPDAAVLRATCGHVLQLLPEPDAAPPATHSVSSTPPSSDTAPLATHSVSSTPPSSAAAAALGAAASGDEGRREPSGRIRSTRSDTSAASDDSWKEFIRRKDSRGAAVAGGHKDGFARRSVSALAADATATLSHTSAPPLAGPQPSSRAAPASPGYPTPGRDATLPISHALSGAPQSTEIAVDAPAPAGAHAGAGAVTQTSGEVKASAGLEGEVSALRARLQEAARTFSLKETALRREVIDLRSRLERAGSSGLGTGGAGGRLGSLGEGRLGGDGSIGAEGAGEGEASVHGGSPQKSDGKGSGGWMGDVLLGESVTGGDREVSKVRLRNHVASTVALNLDAMHRRTLTLPYIYLQSLVERLTRYS